MSLAIQASKAGARGPYAAAQLNRRAYMGDPGIFGFLGKAIGTVGSFLPGPLGTAAKTIGGALSGGSGPSSAGPSSGITKVAGVPQLTPPIVQQNAGSYGGGISINPPFAGGPGVGITTYLGPTGGSSNGGQVQAMNGKAPSGYHWNKTSYFLKDGTYVPEGTKLVKNRRRNPLNPRAASRAISRLESAKKAVKRLDRISVKCRRCGRARCSCK